MIFFLLFFFFGHIIGFCHGDCGNDLSSIRENCISLAQSNPGKWEQCDFCICQEMGGSCKSEQGWLFECELRSELGSTDPGAAIGCRLSFQYRWFVTLCFIALLVGAGFAALFFYWYAYNVFRDCCVVEWEAVETDKIGILVP